MNSRPTAPNAHLSLSETTPEASKDLGQSRVSFLEHCSCQSFLLQPLQGAQRSYEEWWGCQRTPNTVSRVVQRRSPNAEWAVKHCGSLVAAWLGYPRTARHRTPRQKNEGNAEQLRLGNQGSPRFHLEAAVPRQLPAASPRRHEGLFASQEWCPFLEKTPNNAARPASGS
jgi:hypothetical protein